MTSSIRYTRSLGPSSLIHALKSRQSLHCTAHPVTFLAKLPQDDTPDHEIAQHTDSWDYGCGSELGIFAIFEHEDHPLEVHTSSPPQEDQHNPDIHKNHVWLDPSTQPLPFEQGIYIRSPEELAKILHSTSVEEAQNTLKEYRNQPVESVYESAISHARQLEQDLQNLHAQMHQLQAIHASDHPEHLLAMMKQLALPTWLLSVHPEHLSPLLRSALEHLHLHLQQTGSQHP